VNLSNKTILKANRLILLGLLAFVFSCTKDDNPNNFNFSKTAAIDLPQQHVIHGLDLSHFNGSIKWSQLSKIDLFDTVSIKFIYIKATEGRKLVDPMFKKNWQEAKTKNIIRGAYHFYVPDRDPLEQATNFCKVVQLKEGDLPPVCDFETVNSMPQDKLKRNIRIFLDKLQKNYGVRPIIYTNKKLYHKLFKNDFSEFQYWIAHYETKEVDQSIDNLVFWQHNKEGKLPGHKGKFDYNVFLGDEEDFRLLLIQ